MKGSTKKTETQTYDVKVTRAKEVKRVKLRSTWL